MVSVKVYSTQNCPYCRLAKAYLEKLGVVYENIDVGTDRLAAKEMIELSGQYGVPVIVVDDEVISGFNTDRLNELFGGGRREGDYDVIILGGGPAGMTAATYAARKALKNIIITENIGGQALESWAIENYMGFRMVTGNELMEKFEEKIREEGIQIEFDSVITIEPAKNRFVVGTLSGQTFSGKSLIITTGVRPRWLGLTDEQKFIGHGESVCSTCDGPLFKDKVVGIVGGGNYALTTAIEMSSIAKSVYLIVRSKIRADDVYVRQYRDKENIHTLVNYVVSGLHGDAFLSGITVKERDTGEEEKITLDGLFLAIGHDANTDFLDGFVDVNEIGEILVDENCHTSRDGVFAAGDVTSVNGKQVIIAAGEGAKAALEVYGYLIGK
ncbi:MAG: FAD-dependent oxidoreductase [Euryarchaeota archaeon]|nr:FAD-dependent oxidoreductase [Euryarchaeota archaeon]